jgi:molybdopterin-guanine dinucleotide biosynthesis protein A
MPNPDSLLAPKITVVILAGGRGARMGGVDKGLQLFQGRTLVENALARLRAQAPPAPSEVLINANRNAEVYERLEATVVSDAAPDFSGPLAGFLAALVCCTSPYLLTVPCDVPKFPLDLCARMWGALHAHGAEIAVAYAPETDRLGAVTLRSQPVFCLMQTGLGDSLRRYMAGGGRKIDTWIGSLHSVGVAFDKASDDPKAFANANTLEELARLNTVF